MELDHNYLKYYKLQDNDLILDIGATNGEFAKDFIGDILRTNSLYVAVEPAEFNINYLASFLNKNLPNNSKVIKGAVADVDGTINLRVSKSYLYHSVSRNVWAGNFYKEIPVPSYKLDTLITSLGRDVSFLKCDVEGAEVEIFSAFTLWDRVRAMAIAAYHRVNDNQQETSEIIAPLFREHGFYVTVESGDKAGGFAPLNVLYAERR